MFYFNEDLMVREDDMSLFSLENMEVYEFNKEGFEAIMIVKNAENGITYDKWVEVAKNIKGIDDSDIKMFWEGLKQRNIIVEKEC